MAKKTKEPSIETLGGIDSILKLVKSVDSSAEIIEDSAQSNIQEWIPTGNYILNACMSGDLFKAIPSGRIISFCGPSGCLPANETIDIYVMTTHKSQHNIWDEAIETVANPVPKTYGLDYTDYKNEIVARLKKDALTYDSENLMRDFKTVCERHRQRINIIDLFTKFRNKTVFVSTPDGWQLIGDYVQKLPRDIYRIETANHSVKCSADHLIQTQDGWKYARNIAVNDFIVTKATNTESQIEAVIAAELIGNEPVYDFEVLHVNHRYWAGTGISSHNTGKSFLACSVCREAQKMGYTPIYMDSEGAIDAAFVKRLGVDPSRLIIKPVQTIFETSQFVANLCVALQEQQDKTGTHDKILFVLDSLGNLTSEKERDDTLSGNQKADFTKAKDVKAMFRVNATKLNTLGIPWVITNHTYACCSGETEVEMADHSYKHLEVIEIGDLVETTDGVHEVTNKFEYDVNDYIEFEFPDGLVIRCTDKHKFMVKGEDGEPVYKTAAEITEDDEFILNEPAA